MNARQIIEESVARSLGLAAALLAAPAAGAVVSQADLYRQLADHEGVRRTVYRGTAGHNTV